MSKIDMFLQKKKMQENHRGIYTVMIAYVLSFLMLMIGSDTFYNISSSAAGINKEIEEETQEVLSMDVLSPRMGNFNTQVLQTKMLNTYQLMDNPKEEESELVSDDTNWLLGYAMDTEQYNDLLSQINEFEFVANKENEVKDVAEDAIESLTTTKETSIAIWDVTKEEVEMLQQIVEAEASGEDLKGKILIANVVFNRMTDDEFPDTIEGVICQKVNGDYQFSPLKDKRFWTVEASKETKEAVRRVLQGEDHSEGALYFIARKRTKKSSAKWFDNNLEWLFKHGGHEFYRNK